MAAPVALTIQSFVVGKGEFAIRSCDTLTVSPELFARIEATPPDDREALLADIEVLHIGPPPEHRCERRRGP